MDTGVVTTKGQVVIPSRIRHRLEIKKGTRICFIERNGDLIIRPITDVYIESIKGSVRTNGKMLRTLLEDKKKDRKA